MGRGLNKAERLKQMEWDYTQRAYSDTEMAERLGVDRATVFRDRRELTAEHPFTTIAPGRYRIDRKGYISHIDVTLHEALALYLAARRSSRQTRLAQPHAASALEKLAVALKQPMTERLVRAAQSIMEQSTQPERVKVLEVVTQAWVEQRKLEITYRALNVPRSRQHLIHPYLIEPSIWSDGVYLIGHSETHGGLATFKIERIETAEKTIQSFEIPETFDEQELLRHAWGIWYREGELITVRLRFRPGAAAQRLAESIWHPNQQPLQPLEDGGCIWQAQVAEWQEMLPWVRGWGADVEVLEPEGMRKQVAAMARQCAELYGYTCSTGKSMSKIYYAHTKGQFEEEWQTLLDHLESTARLAAELGQDAGLSDWAAIAGRLHDLGKYQQAFQERLKGSKRKVNHTNAGAKTVRELFADREPFATLLAYCIAGHHGGLPDYGSPIDTEDEPSMCGRLKKDAGEFGDYQKELDITTLNFPKGSKLRPVDSRNPTFTLAFFTRMLYSTLVDADFLDTETFVNGPKPRGGHADIPTLAARFAERLERFDHPTTPINQQRTQTLHQCINQANQPQGLFTLTLPTGSGKTLASMAFALEHARRHGLKRVVYVIPYTSIIEQNAGIFKEELGVEAVLEHHANFDFRGEQQDYNSPQGSLLQKLKLATENWDIPIVVTTTVQFFESLYANRSSRCRKIHNLAKSVIIFDEVQLLPRDYLKPCLYAVAELVQNYGCSAVFCTATQPDLEPGLPPGQVTRELIDDLPAQYDFYKRVQVINRGKLDDDTIAGEMNLAPQALCIVNTRRHARAIYPLLDEEGRFHLSTLMCPVHRRQVIGEIEARLSSGQPCRVVSTQLLEAGVDLDFPLGYRALAGLESIAQAAGRVNRNKRVETALLYVFESDSDSARRAPKYIRQSGEVARMVLERFPDPMSIEAIRAYYHELNQLQSGDAFDYKNILNYFKSDLGTPAFAFKTAADNFHLIEETTQPVIIPWDEKAVTLLEKLLDTPYPNSLARALQPYTVNIYQHELEALQNKLAVEVYLERFNVLSQTSLFLYHDDTGLEIPANEQAQAIYVD